MRVQLVTSLIFVGMWSLTMAAYPAHYEVGYGFVNHGGVGPHGHYLPAVAQVKVHKDPFHSSYSLDEEGPTHYKYIRHTSANPIIHHAHPIAPIAPIHHHHHEPVHHHGHHHHHHLGVEVPLHGGVIAGVPVAPIGLGLAGYYHGYEGYPLY